MIQESDEDTNRPVTASAAAQEFKRRDIELTRLNERLQKLDRARMEEREPLHRGIRDVGDPAGDGSTLPRGSRAR